MTDASPLTSSVLVTTYNGERFIEAQLDSIRTQSRPVSQVLVFDDGSTDNTATIVTDFIARHDLDDWSFLVNPTNLGPSSNNLTHLEQLTGDIVFLADQDDEWEPNKVEVMAGYMSADPQLTLVVSRTRIIDEHGAPLPQSTVDRSIMRGRRQTFQAGPQPLAFEEFLGYSRVPLHAMCVRGSTIRDIGASGSFPELSRSLGADWYIGIWSTIIGSCLVIPDVLVRRRVHGANISLGRLRKSTVLSATGDRRLDMLQEAQRGHDSLLNNSMLNHHVSDQQRTSISRMINFIGKRVEFARSASPFKAIELLFRLGSYRRSAGSWRAAARMWVSDVMYAYNINWRLRRRSR